MKRSREDSKADAKMETLLSKLPFLQNLILILYREINFIFSKNLNLKKNSKKGANRKPNTDRVKQPEPQHPTVSTHGAKGPAAFNRSIPASTTPFR